MNKVMRFKNSFSICIALVVVIIIAQPAVSLHAQAISLAHLKQSMAMNDRVHFLAPDQIKKASKKMLTQFKPLQYSVEASGCKYKDDVVVLLYKTNLDWNNNDSGLQVWKIMSEITNTFKNHSFIESGYFENEKLLSTNYFTKVSFEDEQQKKFGILTFLSIDGKMLYVLLLSNVEINSEWAQSLEVSP